MFIDMNFFNKYIETEMKKHWMAAGGISKANINIHKLDAVLNEDKNCRGLRGLS